MIKRGIEYQRNKTRSYRDDYAHFPDLLHLAPALLVQGDRIVTQVYHPQHVEFILVLHYQLQPARTYLVICQVYIRHAFHQLQQLLETVYVHLVRTQL